VTKKRVPSTPTPTRRRRSLLPIVAIATIVLPIIALGVVFFRWSSSIQNDLNFIRNAIAAANEPDSLEDLVASYSAVPDSENAARLYLEAFKEFGKIDITKERINTLVEVTDGLDHNAEYPPDHIRDLRSMIADAEPGLELLEQATQRPKSHYSIDLMLGTQTDLPHLKELDFAAQYLYQASELALLHGDTAAALRWQAALIPMGSSLVDEPTLLSQLVAIEIDGIALDALERLLNKARLDDAQLQRLDALYAAAIRPHTLRKIMIAERCMSVGEVRDFVDEMLEAGEDTDNKKYESPGFPFSLFQSTSSLEYIAPLNRLFRS
jgi:hypothetical protein